VKRFENVGKDAKTEEGPVRKRGKKRGKYQGGPL
jgi:hypothetical protein